MIVDLRLNFAFVHIPRCAGISITRALLPQLSDSCRVDMVLRHRMAYGIRREIGPERWDLLRLRFAVIRSPWEIVESDYRLTLRAADVAAKQYVTGDWWRRVRRAATDRGFGRFVEREYLGRHSGLRKGGFWRTWCLDRDGTEIGVEPILFGELPDRWENLCGRLSVSVALPHLNAAPGPRQKWTAALRDAIGDFCHEDVSRFGFQPPEATP